MPGDTPSNAKELANSDVALLRLFKRFLAESLGVDLARFTVRLNVYLDNGRELEDIENYWLRALNLQRDSLRGHQINHFPTSTSGKKKDCLPYGVCTLRVTRSTRLLHHIYGAIQEYGGFEEPRWLDGLYP